MGITRKAFLIDIASGLGLGALAGCGGGSDAGAAPGAAPGVTPATGNCAAEISGNHGHALTVPIADLDSTTDKTYSIQGDADHSHLVTFSVAALADLKAGRVVSLLTTVTLGHQHGITENCT